MVRAAQPEHRGHKQYICSSSFRLIRGKPLLVHEGLLKEHMTELLQKEAQGLLYVTTQEGALVDLATLQVLQAPAESPPRQVVLDSAANDKPAGISLSPHAGEPPPPDTFEMPVDPPAAAIDLPIMSAPKPQNPVFNKNKQFKR